jgi:hypothetical protein
VSARLGDRQLDVLRAAEAKRSWTQHTGQGRMSVVGLEDTYDDGVLDRLLELGLVALGVEHVGGHYLELTPLGLGRARAPAERSGRGEDDRLRPLRGAGRGDRAQVLPAGARRRDRGSRLRLVGPGVAAPVLDAAKSKGTMMVELTDKLLRQFTDRQLDEERQRRVEDRRAAIDGLVEALRLPYEPTEGERSVHEVMAQHYGAHEARQVLGFLGRTDVGYEPGGFTRLLLDAAFKADRQNLVRLSWGFPSLVAAVWDYKYGAGETGLVEAADR